RLLDRLLGREGRLGRLGCCGHAVRVVRADRLSGRGRVERHAEITLPRPVPLEDPGCRLAGQESIALDDLDLLAEPQEEPLEPRPLADPEADPQPVAGPFVDAFMGVLIGDPSGAWSEIKD